MELVIDIETNGLDPSVIHMIGILDIQTEEFFAFVGEEEIIDAIEIMANADVLVGHNVLEYDLPVIERLLDGAIRFDRERVIDTLVLSRALLPGVDGGHGLRAWGRRLGDDKIDYSGGWDAFDPLMVPYCEQDCRLTLAVLTALEPFV